MDEDTLLGMFDKAVREHRGKKFLHDRGNWLSYGEVDDLARKVVGFLREQDVAAGDRILVALPNSALFPIILYGILRIGATIVPANPLLKGRELAMLVDHSQAKVAILAPDSARELQQARPDGLAAAAFVAGGVAEGFVEFETALERSTPANDWPQARKDDIAAFLYTSGTTGDPKATMLSHGALAAAIRAWVEKFALTSDDRQIAMLPMFHSFGFIVVLNTTMSVGGSLVIIPRFLPEPALEAISEHKITVLTAVTTMFGALLDVAENRTPALEFPAMRLAGGGAASIPPDIVSRAVATFGCPMGQGYGMTECGTAATFTAHKTELALGEVGTPMFNIELGIVDDRGDPLPDGEVGEIVVRGPAVMTGYYQNPEATAAALKDGWLYTGDLGLRTPDGQYFFKDRKKELIIRGGFNVSPGEVEAVLYEHPDVKTAAVMGIPDSRLGEEVVAFVVRKSKEPIDTLALREFVQGRVAPYKYPRHVVELEALPLAPNGKVLKKNIDAWGIVREHLASSGSGGAGT
ncbi:4-coumarate--CoA ligase [Sphingobium indicum IP26]|uniref:4-coumarate--CoA ligase n=1 Tax=Sphingobium indicum F2 TaxID=1450518 RepID=A0A8E0WU74_9SPHN|nr:MULTISPECIES: AMP-binding protein [Sphingobium]EPR11781.1 4-coumarate--CoA ligase [Sphingobium indicum IP26]EQB01564.1 4-coumarate--CoA ligase [Sphingobium sp. HDIP04]KER36988.1 4-coumarate--CoA ligase [Sphingobium indicum F2]